MNQTKIFILFVAFALLVSGCQPESESVIPIRDEGVSYTPEIQLIESVASIPFRYEVVHILSKEFVSTGLFLVEEAARFEGATAIVAVTEELKIPSPKSPEKIETVHKGAYLLIKPII